MSLIPQLTPIELKEKLDNNESLILVDCREPHEFEICKIEKAILIPLSQFTTTAPQKLDQEASIVIHCHHGGRSQRACEYLASVGYKKVSNLKGGIDAWAQQIDPQMKRY